MEFLEIVKVYGELLGSAGPDYVSRNLITHADRRTPLEEREGVLVGVTPVHELLAAQRLCVEVV